MFSMCLLCESVCECVYVWARFRRDPLTCWLGVLSLAHTEPVGVGCWSWMLFFSAASFAYFP